MELRRWARLVRSRKWLVIEAMVLVAIGAAVASSLRTPSYRAESRVLLHPDDPAEHLNPSAVVGMSTDFNRYLEGQREIVESQAVAQLARESMAAGDEIDIGDHLSVTQVGRSAVLRIVARHPDPIVAADIADSVARGYIENRRQRAVAGLQAAADEVQSKLGPIQAAITELDGRIATLEGAGGGETRLLVPDQLPGGTPLPGLESGLDLGGLPTTSEALKAARYAAAVQYETLYGRLQELVIDISLKRGEAELIAEAKIPEGPVSPRPVRDAALGSLAGLLLGTGLVVAKDQLADQVGSADDLEAVTGDLPVLARLPFDRVSARTGEVASACSPQSPLSEAVRSLRTSIQYSRPDEPVRTFVVTSSVPGEGKSLVSANLAAAFAQGGYRTVLVAGDLRHHGVASLFGIGADVPGLTDLVAGGPGATHQEVMAGPARVNGLGTCRPGDHIPNGQAARPDAASQELGAFLVATTVANLCVLPPGPTPPQPAELLGSRRTRSVLGALAQMADVVIIDAPPLLPVTDAVVLAGNADAVVMVAALGQVRRDALTRAKAILDQARLPTLGVVANKVPDAGQGYEYSYGDAPRPRRGDRRGSFRRREPSRSRRRARRHSRWARRDDLRRRHRRSPPIGVGVWSQEGGS